MLRDMADDGVAAILDRHVLHGDGGRAIVAIRFSASIWAGKVRISHEPFAEFRIWMVEAESV